MEIGKKFVNVKKNQKSKFGINLEIGNKIGNFEKDWKFGKTCKLGKKCWIGIFGNMKKVKKFWKFGGEYWNLEKLELLGNLEKKLEIGKTFGDLGGKNGKLGKFLEKLKIEAEN